MKILLGPTDLLPDFGFTARPMFFHWAATPEFCLQFLAILIVLVFLPNLAAQQGAPMSDPAVAAAMRAQREGRTTDAEKILLDAIQNARQADPPDPRLVFYLKVLSTVYSSGHEPSKALDAAEQVLKLDQQTSGEDGPAALADISNIAIILEQQGKNDDAEQLLKKAVDLARQSSNPDPRLIVQVVGNLGALYSLEKRWAEAETPLEDALKNCGQSGIPQICGLLNNALNNVYKNENRVTGEGSLDTVIPSELASLERTAQRYTDDGTYVQAEATYRQAISWIEQHPKVPLAASTSTTLQLQTRLTREYDLLGHVLEKEGLNSEAEGSFKKELELTEANLNPKQPVTAAGFNFSGLLALYRSEGRLNEIESIITHILTLQEQALGQSSLRVADTLFSLASVYSEEQKYTEAVPLYERVLLIQDVNLGPDKMQLLRTLTAYSAALRKLHRDSQAAEVQARIEAIQKR